MYLRARILTRTIFLRSAASPKKKQEAQRRAAARSDVSMAATERPRCEVVAMMIGPSGVGVWRVLMKMYMVDQSLAGVVVGSAISDFGRMKNCSSCANLTPMAVS